MPNLIYIDNVVVENYVSYSEVYVIPKLFCFVQVEKLTDLDKLYLALADVKMESYFNSLCYSLNITSLSALKDYSAKPDKKIMDSDDMDILKEKIGTKDFDFGQLSQVTITRLKKYKF